MHTTFQWQRCSNGAFFPPGSCHFSCCETSAQTQAGWLSHPACACPLDQCGSVADGGFDRAEDRLGAIENARLHTAALGKAALEERQRLARELHDSVSQALYGIALGARTARTLLDRDPTLVTEPLDYVLNLADAGLTEMRALIFPLRPELLEREGLSVALTRQADALRARYGIAVQTAICDEPDIPLAVKEALARIAQEALHNVVKHANAKSVNLRLTASDGALTMIVSDDGVGFDPSGPHLGHLGLQSMRERITALRGTIDVQSAPSRGARLTVRIPIAG